MTFVLDASVALAFCFQDEASSFTDSVLDALRRTRAAVPLLWVYEVANGFVTAERRERITATKAKSMVAFLTSLPIDVQPVLGAFGEAVHGLHALGMAAGITAYDAAYLELCQRLDAPLATLDGEGRRAGLKKAAARAKVRLFAI